MMILGAYGEVSFVGSGDSEVDREYYNIPKSVK